jgi:hypothetical protein
MRTVDTARGPTRPSPDPAPAPPARPSAWGGRVAEDFAPHRKLPPRLATRPCRLAVFP